MIRHKSTHQILDMYYKEKIVRVIKIITIVNKMKMCTMFDV